MARINVDKIYSEVKNGERDKLPTNLQPMSDGSKVMMSTDMKPRLIKKDAKRQ